MTDRLPADKTRMSGGKRSGRRVRCLGTGVIYQSVAAAARDYGVSKTAVVQAVENGWRCGGGRGLGHLWEYVTKGEQR